MFPIRNPIGTHWNTNQTAEQMPKQGKYFNYPDQKHHNLPCETVKRVAQHGQSWVGFHPRGHVAEPTCSFSTHNLKGNATAVIIASISFIRTRDGRRGPLVPGSGKLGNLFTEPQRPSRPFSLFSPSNGKRWSSEEPGSLRSEPAPALQSHQESFETDPKL